MFTVAQNLISEKSLPNGTKIERISEGLESAIFKQYFNHWNETSFGHCLTNQSTAEWNIEDLHFEARKRMAKSAGSAVGY